MFEDTSETGTIRLPAWKRSRRRTAPAAIRVQLVPANCGSARQAECSRQPQAARHGQGEDGAERVEIYLVGEIVGLIESFPFSSAPVATACTTSSARSVSVRALPWFCLS